MKYKHRPCPCGCGELADECMRPESGLNAFSIEERVGSDDPLALVDAKRCHHCASDNRHSTDAHRQAVGEYIRAQRRRCICPTTVPMVADCPVHGTGE